jgi:type I restriction enzyme, R subunit
VRPNMPKPGEHKTVQSRILKYAEEIGWTFVPRHEAQLRRNFTAKGSPQEACKSASLFFDDVLYQQVRAFNPNYTETSGALAAQLSSFKADIYGNRDFLAHLRNEGKFFYAEENRELDLKLIEYDDLIAPPEKRHNVYEVTEEFYFHNGHYGNRADVVFLINGIPILVIECKNANKNEAIAIGIDQLRRYHTETPELLVPYQLFTATEAIGFAYGVTWNMVRRNIFNWKNEQIGNLEAKIKTFCDIPTLLGLLKNYIVFAEKDEDLNKYILKQHQTAAVEQVIERALDSQKNRGLVWHTQGSGKTYTMIKSAELLFKANKGDKPTILLLIDRNELEDQMLKNLAALRLENVAHAKNIKTLETLLETDYRGIIISTVQKFRGMKPDINPRSSIYVLIDEAHRTTGGDLGNFLMAAVKNATFIGFTGTPIDRTAHGKGTFKTFNMDEEGAAIDESGYLHKYSMGDSIKDKTTLPLYYNLAPNQLLVPAEVLEQEFLSLAETEGISDIDELNRILDRAVNLKNFLKAENRINKVAKSAVEHYTQNVEPLGYKAFLVAVDREACTYYKDALDQLLPPEYSEIVYTGNHNDNERLKRFHLDPKREKQIRKSFTKPGEFPKILIVTEKLLTGFDAPILYAMYLDKPLRDHTLLQAIMRVNRPYENEAQEMVKPHGFVLDYVGIFNRIEKALAFDSQEINAVLKDIKLLKTLFKEKMVQKAPSYMQLIKQNFNDKDVDNLIEHFRDQDCRREFFKEYKEIEMLYEIISPDAFLRPYLDDYGTLSAIYEVVRRAYTKQIMIDREFQRKTNELVQKHIDSTDIPSVTDFIEINAQTIETISQQDKGEATKVINLIKSIEKQAEEESDDPTLILLSERAKAIQENFEERQTTTQEALSDLFKAIEEHERRKKEQAKKGFNSLTYFVYLMLFDAGVPNADEVSKQIGQAFIEPI